MWGLNSHFLLRPSFVFFYNSALWHWMVYTWKWTESMAFYCNQIGLAYRPFRRSYSFARVVGGKSNMWFETSTRIGPHVNNYWSAVSQNVFWGGFGNLLPCLLDKTVREQKKREKNARQSSGERGDTTAATMETQREAKAPLISSLSQNLCSFTPPLQISQAASHGVGWAYVDHLGSPERHKQMKEQLRKRPVFSPGLSADHFGLFSPQILRRSSFGGSARFSFSFSEPPIIPFVMISPPLRHPVSACLEKWELSLIKGCLLKEQMIHPILGRSLWKERS